MVIGHRGASGHRPEHTLASYRLAIQLGADYVEPDLVSTSDRVLVARHENEIGATTDVADHVEFASRRTTKTIDGLELTGWFTEDFTLAELKTLRATERLPEVRPASSRYDGRYEIATFDEVLELVRKESRARGRRIGVCPELKRSTYFDAIGLSLEQSLLAALGRHRLDRRGAKVCIESFETASLKWFARRTDLTLIQLVEATGAPADLAATGVGTTYADLVTPEGLREISTYASGVSVHKDLVLPRDAATGEVGDSSTLVGDAHGAGLQTLVWTLRDENRFLAANFRCGTDPNAPGDAVAEAMAFLDAGVDGLFCDQPGTGFEARQQWLRTRDRAS